MPSPNRVICWWFAVALVPPGTACAGGTAGFVDFGEGPSRARFEAWAKVRLLLLDCVFPWFINSC